LTEVVFSAIVSSGKGLEKGDLNSVIVSVGRPAIFKIMEREK